MEFDKSTIAVSSEYFIKMVFSVHVQSFVYNVKRTGDKTHPCGTPVEMHRSPDNAPLNQIYDVILLNYAMLNKQFWEWWHSGQCLVLPITMSVVQLSLRPLIYAL